MARHSNLVCDAHPGMTVKQQLPWRIVVADQDPYTRELARSIAAELGGYSVAVDSGTQALHVLSWGPWLAAICTDRLEPPGSIRLVCLARRAGISVPFLLLDSSPTAQSDLAERCMRDVVVRQPPLQSVDLKHFLRQRILRSTAYAV